MRSGYDGGVSDHGMASTGGEMAKDNRDGFGVNGKRGLSYLATSRNQLSAGTIERSNRIAEDVGWLSMILYDQWVQYNF